MTNPRYPLRINVGFLIHSPIGTNHDFEFDLPVAELSEDLILTELKGKARISRTQQGLLVEGDFSAQVPQDCVRCLAGFNQYVSADFDELYAFRYRRNPESELFVPEDGQIDLAPLVRDYLILELPIMPICNESCKGLCPLCGANLNETECEHAGKPHNDL